MSAQPDERERLAPIAAEDSDRARTPQERFLLHPFRRLPNAERSLLVEWLHSRVKAINPSR
ncbi:MAG TPA: hypothetical protein VJ770_11225 [Stellaceae bacterium]|nr:hypothetical protein [Stellaceae bacterium]